MTYDHIEWKGRGLRMYARAGTSDWNTIEAAVGEDEYGLESVEMRDKTVFDVGSHIGSIGVWCAACGAYAVCIEPIPDNAALIRGSADLNGVGSKVMLLETVAGKSGAVVDIHYGYRHDENARHHAFIGNQTGEPEQDGLFVRHRAVSLADVIAKAGAPDIIKLDCEGGEWDWLEEPEIASVPLIVGEWHPTDGHQQIDVALLLGNSHRLTFSGPHAGPGGFRAETW